MPRPSNGYAAPPMKRPAAQAGQLAPAQNGAADVNIAPAVPKYNQVVPASSAANASAWGGSQHLDWAVFAPDAGKKPPDCSAGQALASLATTVSYKP